ncbi:MAG: alpha/beta fold hydrolase [Planctomycetes bacterium]|nr:alpha/beta fold hydrolase [Planctomycetota bacterium]
MSELGAAVGWVIAGIFAALVLAEVLVHALVIPLVLPIFERRPPFSVEPAGPHPGSRSVRIPTSAGLELAAEILPSRSGGPARGVVVFCPEMSGSRHSAAFYCEGLREAGWSIVAFDFRNQGDSDHLTGYDPLHWVTRHEVDDVLAVIDWTQRQAEFQDLPVGLFGISRGGGAALAAATRRPEVEAIAAEGVFTTDALMLHYTLRWAELFIPPRLMRIIPQWHVAFTLRMVRWVSQWRRHCRYAVLEPCLPRLRARRLLLIAGGRDTYVPPEVPQAMGRRIAGRRMDVWVVPEARHNEARRIAPEDYDRRLVTLFGAGAPIEADVVAEPV